MVCKVERKPFPTCYFSLPPPPSITCPNTANYSQIRQLRAQIRPNTPITCPNTTKYANYVPKYGQIRLLGVLTTVFGAHIWTRQLRAQICQLPAQIRPNTPITCLNTAKYAY